MRTVLIPLVLAAGLLWSEARIHAGFPQASAAATPAAAAFADAVKLHDAGKFADAIPLFQRAVALGFQPINQARFRLARAYARAGQTDRRSRNSRPSPLPASRTSAS